MKHVRTFRDSVTHRPLVVSEASTNVIVRALVAGLDAGRISEEDYALTYAEVCEPGRLPQMFGGGRVDADAMSHWQERGAW